MTRTDGADAGRVNRVEPKPQNEIKPQVNKNEPLADLRAGAASIVGEIRNLGERIAFKINEQFNQAMSVSQARMPPPVRQDVVDRYVETMLNGAGAGNNQILADTLAYDDSLTSAEKQAIVAGIVKSGHQNASTVLTTSPAGADEQTMRDNMRVIAGAMQGAYQSGALNSADLRGYAQTFGAAGTEKLIANLSTNGSATRRGGVIEALGREAQTLRFDRAAALAFTSSPELLRNNLTTPAARARAFDGLNSYLQEQTRYLDATSYRIAFNVAQTNAARLMGTHGSEIFDSKLQTPQGQAQLQQFFRNTLFSLHTPAAARTGIENSIQTYVGNEIASAGTNAPLVGDKLGELLGTIQLAGREAIANASQADKPTLQNYATGAIGKFVGGLLGRGIPGIAGVAANALVSQFIADAFRLEDPNPEELGRKFVEELTRNGGSIDFGKNLLGGLNDKFNQVLARLNREIENTTSPRRRQELDDARTLIEQLLRSMNDSYQLKID